MSEMVQRRERVLYIDTVRVPTPEDNTTAKPWGSAHAIVILESAIEEERRKYAAFFAMAPGEKYQSKDMIDCIKRLGEFLQALGVHLKVQALRMKDDGEITVRATFLQTDFAKKAD